MMIYGEYYTMETTKQIIQTHIEDKLMHGVLEPTSWNLNLKQKQKA